MRKKPVKKRVNVKANPRYYFASKDGAIEIRYHEISITGTVEGAALAFAEDALKTTNRVGTLNSWNYMGVISVVMKDGKYTVDLLPAGQALIDLDTWNSFKSGVEKICNNLTAFI